MAEGRQGGQTGAERWVILLINDEYGTSKGGVSTINLEAVQTLRGKAVKDKTVVYATALRVPKQDQEAADRDGITLITPYQSEGDKREPSLDWLTLEFKSHFPKSTLSSHEYQESRGPKSTLPPHVDVIVGHADITDTAARNIHDEYYMEADLIMFTHVLPEDTEYFKGGQRVMEASEKERIMIEQVHNAKAAFSVGHRIFKHFQNKYRGVKKPREHHLFFPRPSKIFEEVNIQPDSGEGELVVLSFGRVKNVENLKGCNLAGRAIGIVRKYLESLRWIACGISEDGWEKSLKILEEALNSGDLRPTLRPYGTQEEIMEDMMTAHLVLMPSRSEPFGLVGLEAIAAGIPVIISDKSGLADMIKKLVAEEKLPPGLNNRIVETSMRDSDLDKTAEKWADKIRDTLTDTDRAFRDAKEFKDALLKSKYWEDSEREFLQACSIIEITLKDVDKAAAEYKAAVEDVISKISQQVDNLDRERKATAENCEQVEKEVKQHYEELISKLQQEKQEMISKIQKIKEDRERELTREKEKLETELENSKEEENFFEQILDRKDDTEAALRELRERLQQMEEKVDKLSMQETGNNSLVGQPKLTFKQLLSKVPGGSLSESVRFTIDVEGPAVESLPCSVTITTNNADLTGGKVAPQIEVTSPQGKITLIQTTAHTSPPLAAGKGQTSRVSRVWGAEWRPQQSGKHTLGVCMGGTKDLGSLTVDVSCNNPVVRLGENGSQQGQFESPFDVAVRGDRLYVADRNNQRVQVFDLSGKFCHSFPTGWPEGLAVQTDGTIVVYSGKEVRKFSPSGELLHKFPLGKYCAVPYGLAVQRDGRVVLADRVKHSIFLFEADGTLVKQVGGWGEGEGQFGQPLFVCVDKEDNIIVADKDNHRVQVFDRNLNYKHKFGQYGRQPQDMQYPTGVSADSRGNIVLANCWKDDIQDVFRPDGTWVSTISSDGDKCPLGVAVTEDGHVFVAYHGNHCIRKYRYM
ncbi:PREDICTED: tripartite motif-containing protein 3-like [Branchiostoma belcheri]|uniref:Tripartite motif-containing protein 3-like n=1 Tax=Branchiostoma belcheri TaxID=7741 RepID=A0A6P4ZXT6_BRABE|nr:PREDICTED: tripartite motif-containing protein 3-like [Branchiostoma belcheri]